MSVDNPLRHWEIFAGRLLAFAGFLVLPVVMLFAPSDRLWVYGLYWLFFTALPQGVLELPGDPGSQVFLAEAGWIIAFVFWAVVAFAYTFLTRGLPIRYFLILAYPAIWLVIVLIHGGLWLFGFVVRMDLGM